MSASETTGVTPLTPELAASIEQMLDDAGIHANRQLVRRIVTSGLLLGTDNTDRLDLKITAAALDEMREALAAMRVAPEFASYYTEDLVATSVNFVASASSHPPA